MASAAQPSAPGPAAEVQDATAEAAAEVRLMQNLRPMSYVFSDQDLVLIRSFKDQKTLLGNLKYLCKTWTFTDR